MRGPGLPLAFVLLLIGSTLGALPSGSAVPGDGPGGPTFKEALGRAFEVARTVEEYGLFTLAEFKDARYGLVGNDGVLFKLYEDYGAVTLNGRRIDPLREPASWTGPGVYLVQMKGPVKPEWRAALETQGRILDYAAPFTFLVWMDGDDLATTRALPAVRGIAHYTPDLKLGSSFNGHLDDPETGVSAMVYDPTKQVDPRDLAYLIGGKWTYSFPLQHYTKVRIEGADPSYLGLLLSLPFVIYVDRWTPSEIEGEDSKQIVAGNLNANNKALYDYQAWLTLLGIDGTGVTVGHIDTGVYSQHLDFENRVSGPSWGADSNGHGTHTMSTILGAPIGGDPDGDKFLDGMGMAPKAKGIAHPLSGSAHGPQFQDMVQKGAYVSSNSWNIGSNGANYGSDEKEYDGYVVDADSTTAGEQPLTIFFSAGNAGASGLTRPHAAKDIISVCNGHSNHTSGANINNVATSSSVGPTADGRIKPEICAPGSDIIAANTGTTGGYTKKTGTSMSCPHAAGAGALVVQWYEKTYGVKPQTSMVKAMLVNGAVDMVGGNALEIPNKFEGWGRLNLRNTFSKQTGTAMTHIDDKELATGQEFTVTASPADTTKPLKITLAWQDPPGTAGCTVCVVNDLDLVVDGSGGTYYGNNFASSWSQAGGAASAKDNLENVYLQNPTGSYTIRVKGTNVAQGPQKFSLVISNAGAASSGLQFDTPKGGESYKGGDPVNVAWKSTGQFQPNSLSVAFSKDNGATWDPPFATGQPVNGSAQWTAPAIDSKDGVLRAIAKDLANKDVEVRSGRFSVDSSPPIATVQAMPKVTMSKDFDVVYQATDAVSGIAEVEIFYRVEGGAYASAGKPVSSPYNFSAPSEGLHEFYASAVDKAGHQEAAPASPEANTLVDLTPPSLISSVPANAAKDVALNPKLELVFSEPMDQPSVAAGLTITPAANKGALTWDQSGAKLSFSLGPLKFATQYTITVAGTDRAARPLAPTSVKFDTLAIPPNPSTIQGRVFDVQNQVGLAGATVRAVWEGSEFKRVTTNGTGGFVIDKLPSGAFVVFAEKAAFEPQNRSLNLAEGVVETLDFFLTPPGKPAGTLKGVVKDSGGSPVEGATVTAGKAKAKTAADGLFRFELLAGSYDALATKAGYIDAKESATVDAGMETEISLTLQQKPSTDILSMSVAGIPLLMLILALAIALVAGVVGLKIIRKKGGTQCQYCSTKIPRGAFGCPACGAPAAPPAGEMWGMQYDQGRPPPVMPP